MSTPPNSSVIPPLEESQEIQAIISEVVGKLEEARNEGTWVLTWLGNVRPPDPLRLTPVLLLRHFIEVLDGIIQLIRNQSVEPASILLRSLVETWWHVMFLTDADRDDRSAAYLVWYYHQRRKSFQRLSIEHELGKQFKADLAKDKYSSEAILEKLDQDEVKKSIGNVDKILQQPEYGKMEARYQALMLDKSTRPKSWYHLAGGAMDIQGLARSLGMPVVYDTIYRKLSGTAHGSDIMERRVGRHKSREGMAGIRQIHMLDELPAVVHFSLLASISTYRHIIDEYDPSHRAEIRRWYKQEIRDFLMIKLPTLKITSV